MAAQQAEVVRFALDDALIKRARDVPLIGYIMAHEPENIKRSSGGGYELCDHDSLKISDNGKFFWHSRSIGGYGALDFLIKVRGVKFTDAVEMLTGEKAPQYEASPSKPEQERERGPFHLPPAHRNNDRAIAYLRSRGIDRDILMRCIADKILYESKNGECVFVGFDGDGNAKSAFIRGTKDNTRRDVFGSDKSYGFVLPAEKGDVETLAVFESSIDAISHACLTESESYDFNCHRLSLGGVSPKALLQFLEQNPGIKRVELCLDKDTAGITAAKNINRKLAEQYPHVKVSVHAPKVGKDWNEFLLETKKTTTRPKQAAR